MAAQQDWESQYRWIALSPQRVNHQFDNTIHPSAKNALLEKEMQGALEFQFETDLTNITGLRLDALPNPLEPGKDFDEPFSVEQIELSASLPDNEPFRGRTVRLELVDRNEFLHLAEVQVFSGDVNVALTGTARQSTTLHGGHADRAIDGNTDGEWTGDSVSHTELSSQPWWEVDLGSMQKVSRIVVWNRTDGQLQPRLNHFRVSLLDDRGKVVWQKRIADYPDPKLELYLAPQPIALVSVSENRITDASWIRQHEESQPASAVFETQPLFGYPNGTRLLLRLTKPIESPDRLRVAVTTMETPLRKVPYEVETILTIPRDKRSSEDSQALAAYFRSISPQLDPIRERRNRLVTEIQQVETFFNFQNERQ